MAEAYIVAATRTAGGRRGGRLSGWHATDLAAEVLDDVVARAHADPALVDDVIMGCVSTDYTASQTTQPKPCRAP